MRVAWSLLLGVGGWSCSGGGRPIDLLLHSLLLSYFAEEANRTQSSSAKQRKSEKNELSELCLYP